MYTMNPWKNQHKPIHDKNHKRKKRSICAGLRQYFNVAQHIKQTASLFHQQNWFKIYRNLSFSFKIHQKVNFWLKIYRKSIYLTKNHEFVQNHKKICIQNLLYSRRITNHRLIIFHFSWKCIKNRAIFQNYHYLPCETETSLHFSFTEISKKKYWFIMNRMFVFQI